MSTNSEAGPGTEANANVRYPAGQRLHCRSCGAEVEIVSPCPCEPPDLVLQCCGHDMMPETGREIHLGVE